MQSRYRYVVVGIVGLAIVVMIAMAEGLEWIWLQAEWDDMPILTRQVTISKLIAFLLAAGAATFCLVHRQTQQLAMEVVDELARVTWPTREETGSATLVVIVAVLICSAYLGVFDAVWLWLTDMILGVGGEATG